LRGLEAALGTLSGLIARRRSETAASASLCQAECQTFQAHAALDELEQTVLNYPEGVPEAVLKGAVLRLDEIARNGGR
jgi:hypothetical protein